MGKYTKIIYFCDICKNENGSVKMRGEEKSPLNKCPFCNRGVCADCSLKPQLKLFEDKDTEPIIDITGVLCKECAEEHDIKEYMLNKANKTIGSINIEFSD